MFDTIHEILSARVHKYAVVQGGEPISYRDVLRLWQGDVAFRSFFVSLLTDSPFSAYRWETPPVTVNTVQRHFEFVLLDSPELEGSPDARAFANHFQYDSDTIVVFKNLGKDAILVVPCPLTSDSDYGHLATFVKRAPESQQHALWRTVGQAMEQHLDERPIWLSTAGGGVAWLHLRLDSRPKYYGYAPYRKNK